MPLKVSHEEGDKSLARRRYPSSIDGAALSDAYNDGETHAHQDGSKDQYHFMTAALLSTTEHPTEHPKHDYLS